MAKIRIVLGDWLKNAGIIGAYQVLKENLNSETDIKITKNYIEFNDNLLDNFEENYFKVLIEKNEKNISWYKIVSFEDNLDNLDLDNISDEQFEQINNFINYLKTKLKSASYTSGYLLLSDSEILINLGKKLAAIKKTKKQLVSDVREKVIEQVDILKSIIGYLKRPDVKRIIAAKNIMYDVIQPFWTNVSFLLKTNNKKDMYDLYKKDFVMSAKNYINIENPKRKYNCFTCSNKISKFDKPEAYDLTWLVKVGVDGSRKSSHFWNLTSDAYVCPICNLIYSCIPIGFNILKGKGIFINNNQTAKLLKTTNISKEAMDENNIEKIEQCAYLNIINSMEQKSIENLDKEFENIQVVKIDGNNPSRPYSFNILSRKTMMIVYKNRKILDKLIKISVKITDKYYLNLYNEVITRLYEGKNLFDLISKLMYMYLNQEFKGVYYIYKILEINTYLIGGKEMNFKVTEKFRKYGMALRKGYVEQNNKIKLSGITYRLLNALKIKDTNKFMDTLINAYMYQKKEIPVDFTMAINNVDIFQSVGYAFVIGLQGSDERNNEKDNEEVK